MVPILNRSQVVNVQHNVFNMLTHGSYIESLEALSLLTVQKNVVCYTWLFLFTEASLNSDPLFEDFPRRIWGERRVVAKLPLRVLSLETRDTHYGKN